MTSNIPDTPTPPVTKKKKSTSQKTRYADHVKDWSELTAQLAAIAADLPQLDPQRLALEKILAQARDLTLQQANFQSAKQKASAQLRPLMTEGMKIATALRVNLKQIYGNRSEDLVKFGVQPLRTRAQVAAKPAPQTPSTPPASSGTPGGSTAPGTPPASHSA
ncbi:MAG TPA: hypothetical protein VGH73_14025 [Thermoanaerobaculia bacterium]